MSRRGRLMRLQARLEGPMLVLALVWTVLLVLELTVGLSPWQGALATAIWAVFIAEFALKLVIAPHRLRFVVRNWITVIALVVPALRFLRVLRILRVLRAARTASTLKVIRSLTSGRRLLGDLREVQGAPPTPEMNVALVAMASPAADPDALADLARRLAKDLEPALQAAGGVDWRFHVPEPGRLTSDDFRLAADFLDEAAMRTAEGPYDLTLVITDVGVTVRRGAAAGAASRTARVGVMSTRGLTAAGRHRAGRRLDEPVVRWNAAALALRLLEQVAGFAPKPRRGRAPGPFAFREDRSGPPMLTSQDRARLAEQARELPERELRGGDPVTVLSFHVLMAFRHLGQVLRPLARNGALLLPLSLPGLATAAVAPSFVLLFTAEIWDVGLSMPAWTAAGYALASIVGASLYLAWAQDLFLPRKDKRILTEHLAVANTVIYLSVLAASVGLFLMVGGLMLVLEVFIFPVDLMQTWPTLDHAQVTAADKIRLAAFIATVGVTTGALAGGFDSRTVIRRLALFETAL